MRKFSSGQACFYLLFFFSYIFFPLKAVTFFLIGPWSGQFFFSILCITCMAGKRFKVVSLPSFVSFFHVWVKFPYFHLQVDQGFVLLCFFFFFFQERKKNFLPPPHPKVKWCIHSLPVFTWQPSTYMYSLPVVLINFNLSSIPMVATLSPTAVMALTWLLWRRPLIRSDLPLAASHWSTHPKLRTILSKYLEFTMVTVQYR